MSDPEKTEKKKLSTGKKVVIVLLSILLLLLLLMLAAILYVDGMMGLISRHDPSTPTMNEQQMQEYLEANRDTTTPDYTGQEINHEDVTWETVDTSVFDDKDVINILLVGQDLRPGETISRADTMILCSLNVEKKELTMTSFMRDMYVQIPGYYDHKMNSAYAWGGMDLINSVIKTNFGITVDGNFTVDFDAFETVIDAVGGITIDLTAAEARYLGNWNYGYSGQFQEGENLLNGADALTYARVRSIGNADFDRTARQRKVMTALFDKAKEMDLLELHDLLETVLPLLTTNMDNAKIWEYVTDVLPMLTSLKMNPGIQIPAEGTYYYAWVKEMSVLMPDLEENSRILQEIIYD